MSKVSEQALPDDVVTLIEQYMYSKTCLTYWFNFFDRSADRLSNEAARYKNTALRMDIKFLEDANKLHMHPDLVNKYLDTSQVRENEPPISESVMFKDNSHLSYSKRCKTQISPRTPPVNPKRESDFICSHKQANGIASDKVYTSCGTQTDDIVADKLESSHNLQTQCSSPSEPEVDSGDFTKSEPSEQISLKN